MGDEPKSGPARDPGDRLQSRDVPFGTSGDSMSINTFSRQYYISDLELSNESEWNKIIMVLFMNYTYILKCSDGSLYTGWTNDLEKRIRAHNEGKGAKYTKSRRPVSLAYHETFQTKEEAMRREWEIKQMTRQQKLDIIRADGERSACGWDSVC